MSDLPDNMTPSDLPNDDKEPEQEDAFTKSLAEYQKAIEQEFEVVDSEPEEIAKKTRELFLKALPEVARKVKMLAIHAESETVSLSACKFIHDVVVKSPEGQVDPLSALVSELTKTKEESQNTSD